MGVAVNLALLGYFKYTHFVVNSAAAMFDTSWQIGSIALPLAISFFTFQQIAYLVDAYRGLTHEHDFVQYCLFVAFFPQLIAGPIVHHGQVLPQLRRGAMGLHIRNLSVGTSIFVIGLAKKVLVADEVSGYATQVYSAAAAAEPINFAQAWMGTLAYTLQIYFDFSGYSDMAVGLGRMFGVRLPLNFASPYKAVNIVEFWRRWHMTLSRFLRDYLYIPLGGNRHGRVRRYVNLMLTMLLGGLWHGAAWTFVVWGGLHGLYLVIHHAWRRLRGADEHAAPKRGWTIGKLAGGVVTFLGVVVGWVFFRAADFATAGRMLTAMAGLDGVSFELPALSSGRMIFIFVMLGVVWVMPNTQQLLRRYRPAYGRRPTWDGLPVLERLQWKPDRFWAVVLAALTIACLLQMSRVSEFIYWQF